MIVKLTFAESDAEKCRLVISEGEMKCLILENAISIQIFEHDSDADAETYDR